METLSYSSLPIRKPKESRISKWLKSRPPSVISLLLLLPLLTFRYITLETFIGTHLYRLDYDIATFFVLAFLYLPGSLQRVNWRQMLIMICLAGLIAALEYVSTTQRWDLPYPARLPAWVVIRILPVAIGEWSFTPNHKFRSLGWAVAICVGVGCSIVLAWSLQFTGAQLFLPTFSTASRHALYWSEVLYWPLLMILTWTAIPAGLKLGDHGSRPRRLTAATLILTSVASFLLFFHLLIYPIARKSLLKDGVFNKFWAAAILENRGSPADEAVLWQAAENADWSKPKSFNLWRPDYRASLIDFLIPRDSQRLWAMLRQHPSRGLAGFCAPTFAAKKQYETVPILMRYALSGESPCIKALEKMKVPEAALPILRHSYYERGSAERNFRIDSAAQARVAQLLGKDAGPYLQDLLAYYDEVAFHLPTPLPPDIASETQRVVTAFLSFQIARRRSAAVEHQPIPMPDWDAADTEAIEIEVQRYVDRVNAAVHKSGVSTMPAS
jgi:hypothetical protein